MILVNCPATRQSRPTSERRHGHRLCAPQANTLSINWLHRPLNRLLDCPTFQVWSLGTSLALLEEAAMKKHERIREKVTILPTSMYLSKMHDAGWTLVALEWEREVETSSTPEPPEEIPGTEEIPFGLRIASDCHHLEDDPLETQTLKFLAELIV